MRYVPRVASAQLVALPRLRLACRALPDHADDADLVVAEAAALLSWAREHSRASAPWIVVDGDVVEVAVPIPVGLALPDGLRERELAAGRWAALDGDDARPSTVKALASTLRLKPPGPIVDPGGPIFARITEDGTTAHLRVE